MSELFNQHPAYFLMAVFATALYLFKIVFLLIGGDTDADLDVDTDIDVDSDVHVDGTAAFTLISIQSILAFFMGTGWMGLACRDEWKLSQSSSLLVAAGFGFLMMLLNSYLAFKIKGLNQENKIDFREAIGKEGKAYINIPAKGEGYGQVEINVEGSKRVLQAQSSGEEISSFTTVKVVDVVASSVLVVEKI